MADKMTGRPKKGQLYVPTREAWLDSLASDITPSLVISYLKAADTGQLSQSQQLFDRMVDRDGRLQAVLSTRRLAVTGLDWDIEPDDPDDERSVAAVDAVWEAVGGLDMSELFGLLLDAVPKGVQVAEIIWTPDARIETVNEIPGKMLLYSSKDGVLQVNVGQSKYVTIADEPNKFIVHSPRIKSGTKERRGLLRALAMLWVAKHWAMRDWAAFSEVFGFPMRLGKYPTSATQEQIDTLLEALESLGSDSSAAVPDDMEIDFPAPPFAQSNSAETPMQRIISYADKEFAILALGQNLTTESESGTGTLAGGAHSDVRMDYRNADAMALADTIRRDLFTPIVGYRMGWDVPVPYLEFDISESIDEAARAGVYVQLSQIPGMTFSLAQVREEFALREPIDEDDTLRPAPTDGLTGLAFQMALQDRLARSTRRGAGGSVDAFTVEGRASVTGGDSAFVGATKGRKRGALSPGLRAAEAIAQDGAESEGFDAIADLLDYVEVLAKKCETPEQLIARIQLAATDLDDMLSRAGVTLEAFTDLVGRSMATSVLNGHQAVKDELKVQPKD